MQTDIAEPSGASRADRAPPGRAPSPAFNAARVEYLIVGAYAVSAHGLPRATGDMDLWVRPAIDNAERVWRALAEFGAPLDRLSYADPG